MTVLIKGMEMPDSCYGCQLSRPFYDISYCAIIGRNNAPLRDKKTWCPIIEVPTPHGRLIDATKFKNYIDDKYWDSPWISSTALSMFEQEIKHAPTIIEAEKG